MIVSKIFGLGDEANTLLFARDPERSASPAMHTNWGYITAFGDERRPSMIKTRTSKRKSSLSRRGSLMIRHQETVSEREERMRLLRDEEIMSKLSPPKRLALKSFFDVHAPRIPATA